MQHHIQILDKNASNYVRSLFIDYSSAFNTIQKHIMMGKLLEFNVPVPYCTWILDFLTNRSQYVKTRRETSQLQTINTGAPQGCVLSAVTVLFIMYTSTNNLTLD